MLIIFSECLRTEAPHTGPLNRTRVCVWWLIALRLLTLMHSDLVPALWYHHFSAFFLSLVCGKFPPLYFCVLSQGVNILYMQAAEIMSAGSRLGFLSGENRTRIKEESESLQRLMWVSDPVWRKKELLSLLQAALPFHRLLIYFMVLLHLFLTHLCSVLLFISSLLWSFNGPTLSPCHPVPPCAPLCRLDIWHLWLRLTPSRSQRGRSRAGCAPFISFKCNHNTSLCTTADPLQRLPSHWHDEGLSWMIQHTHRTN